MDPVAQDTELQVLIVDDDPELVAVLAKGVQRKGIVPIAATTGLQAIEAVHRCVAAGGDLRAAVVDFSMPGMGGIEIIKAVRRIVPDLPCVMLTAYTERAIERGAVKAGAMGVIPKPISAQLFGEMIFTVISGDPPTPAVNADALSAIHVPEALLNPLSVTRAEYGLVADEFYVRRAIEAAKGNVRALSEQVPCSLATAYRLLSRYGPAGTRPTRQRRKRRGRRPRGSKPEGRA